MTDKRIPIDAPTRDRLRRQKQGIESYTETLNRLLDTLEDIGELPGEWRDEYNAHRLEGVAGHNCASDLEERLPEELEDAPKHPE